LDIVLVGLTKFSYQQSQFFVASMASWIDFPGIFKLSSLAALVVESSNDDKKAHRSLTRQSFGRGGTSPGIVFSNLGLEWCEVREGHDLWNTY
jgi:hypothetical protein